MSAPAVPPYWTQVQGPPRGLLAVLRPVAGGLIRLAWQVRVHDPELVPASGPVILAANHTGMLDGPLACSMTPRPVHALVKKELFAGALGRPLRALGQIPVDRLRVDPAAIKASLAVLERGDALVIYPEGTRGVGDFGRIKAGVAYLGLCTGAPVVPVACLGVREPGRPVGTAPRLRAGIDVVFGSPIRLPALPWPRRRDVVRQQAARLREILAAHVRTACLRTGRELPGPAPGARPEPGVQVHGPATEPCGQAPGGTPEPGTGAR